MCIRDRYLDLALTACRKGTERAHVVDGRMEGAILREIFSNLGVGTMVYGNDYESIRQMKGEDIGDVLRLMQPLMQEGILAVSYTHLRAHETPEHLVCRLLLE